ncbi:hypothetical protein C8T65DRAFT_26177 [Cerioporus squamosus]|nr:hypothetical protein C8T65DRAFT_26177 [Cerioporus squamosus]
MPRLRRDVENATDDLSEASYIKLCKEIYALRLELYDAAAHLRRRLRIPNSNTRSGLRKVHERLPAIARRLCSVFDMAAFRKEWPICDAVTVIWVDMCADASLCRGLLEEGLLPRTLCLVDVDGTFMLLNLISLLARHGDDTVKLAVLRGLITIFAKWKPAWRSVEYNIEYVLVTLCHCIGIITLPQASAEPHMPPEFSVTFVADLALSALEEPAVSHETIIHAIPLLIACARTRPPRETATRARILDFLAALTHSKNVSLRCVSAWVFFGLPAPHDDSPPRHCSFSRSGDHADNTGLAHRNAVPGSEGRYTTAQMIVVRALLQESVTRGDFYEFGVGVAKFLLEGPSLHEEDDSPDTKASTTEEYGPWHAYLPEAIETLRRREHPLFLDIADVLALEHLSRCASPDTASSHARAVLQRNPRHEYAYFTLCKYSEDREEALQAAIEGLRSTDTTLYLRRRLQAFAIELSFAKALTLLLQTGPSDWRRRQAGLACLQAAIDHTATLTPDAPDDPRVLSHIVDLTLISILVYKGHMVPPELEVIQPLLRRSEQLACTLEKLGYGVVERPTGAGSKALVHHFSQGYSKWVTLVERFDQLDEPRQRSFVRDPLPSDATADSDASQNLSIAGKDLDRGDAYASWWEPHNKTTLASLLRGPLRCSCASSEDHCVQLGPGLAMLYACSWCSCRTAMVRKCSRCQNAWYCDSQCQRADWPRHRELCYGREEPTL